MMRDLELEKTIVNGIKGTVIKDEEFARAIDFEFKKSSGTEDFESITTYATKHYSDLKEYCLLNMLQNIPIAVVFFITAGVAFYDKNSFILIALFGMAGVALLIHEFINIIYFTKSLCNLRKVLHLTNWHVVLIDYTTAVCKQNMAVIN